MNTLKNLFYLIIVSLSIFSCIREFDGPPIAKPEYNGSANMTIAQLKQKYASTQADAPVLIDVDYVIKAYVTGNDESGNIFKQLYIQDETGAINVGIDQNSVYSMLKVGQEIYLNLHGLSMINYGGELQIGFTGTNANRIPWETFNAKVFLNGWPDENNVVPATVKIADLQPDMVNKLIRLENVYFVNGGRNNFTSNNSTTNESLKDGSGRTIDVRTSSYSNFATTPLPSGSGTIIALLGRFNGSWQLTVRSMKDVINFGGEIPTDPETPQPGVEVVFNETFGTGTYPSGNRPKIAEFTDFDMKAPVVYSDDTGNADIRSIAGDNGAHVWFPTRDSKLTITGINTAGKSNLVLTFQIAANLFNATDSGNLNAVTLKCNGTDLIIPSTPVSNTNGDNAKFYTFKFENIPAVANLTLEFAASATANTLGLRLDNIKIAVDQDVILTPGG